MTDATLRPTELIDSDHPSVLAFASGQGRGRDDRERAVSLYYAVRDGFRYDPYRIDLSLHGMKASTVLDNGHGWCVPKATLLAAACRALAIPARVGFADVRNHLSTERMRQVMQTDVFFWHGYTDILIDGTWRKATPAFNVGLCERFDLLPLEFDGLGDSLYHPFDRQGHRHMEYLADRGAFDDVPLARMTEDFARLYPRWAPRHAEVAGADFAGDVEGERGR